MSDIVPIHDNAWWVGVNDRTTDLFESLWPLPNGVSYNAYLLVDDKVAVIDTVKGGFADAFFGKVRSVLGDRKVDYLIANHLEPDHSGCYRLFREIYPEAQIVGNPKTVEYLGHLYGITEGVKGVEDGDTLDLGKQKLQFVTMPMVHWPESMMTLDATTGTLYSNDAFGAFGALEGSIFDDQLDVAAIEDEILRYFANIVAKYASMVQRLFTKVKDVKFNTIAPSHGPVWRTNPGHVAELYRKYSSHESEPGVTIAHGSMYGNNNTMLEAVTAGLREEGMESIRVHDVARTHVSYILRDVWRNKGLVLGAPTYDASIFPPMQSLVHLLDTKVVQQKLVGVFGTHGWAGIAAKQLSEFAGRHNRELIGPTVDAHFSPTTEQINSCREMGRNLARRVREPA